MIFERTRIYSLHASYSIFFRMVASCIAIKMPLQFKGLASKPLKPERCNVSQGQSEEYTGII